jgi:hypothetical protein
MALNPENGTFRHYGSVGGITREDAWPPRAGILGTPANHPAAEFGGSRRRSSSDLEDAQSYATLARPAEDADETSSASGNEDEQLTQQLDPTLPVTQDGLTFERLQGNSTSPTHNFDIPFPLRQP